MRVKYKLLFSFLFFLQVFSNRLNAEEVVIELETEKSKIDIEQESIEASEGVLMKYGDISIRSDNLKKLAQKNVVFSYGNVEFSQGNQIIRASEVVYDMDTKRAKIFNSESYDTDLKLRYGGEETLSEYPNKITVKNGWFTTSPYEVPNYKVNAKELKIYPNRKVVAKDIELNANGKSWFKFPYYVVSLKPASQRATLFPYVGSDDDRGFFGIWGFDYDKGPLAQGFFDFELSEKKKLALKWSNDYSFGNGNSGNIFVNRVVIPFKDNIKEWDFTWNHNVVNTPKKPADERKFYNLGYGLWNLNYKNMTTNLMRATDGVLLRDDYSWYVNKYDKIGFYNFKIDQELGKNGEFNLNYYWTRDKEELRELTKINDFITDRDEIDPRKTDVDLYKSLRYTNGNSDVAINIDNERFIDINPGYVGDLNSYRNRENYSVDMRGPKIRFDYLYSDKDEYGELRNMRERDDADPSSLEDTRRWVQNTAYDRKKEFALTFGNYYPFRKTEFFGYETKNLSEYLTNNLYFGVRATNTDIQKKEYEYDYTRDNPNYNNLFLLSTTDENSRTYKVYEDADTIKRAKKIIYEKYRSQKITVGNDRIDLPFKDSFIAFNFGFENRDYESVYVPQFQNGRKIEDTSSKTGYKIATDASGNEIKQSASLNVVSLDTKLYTTLFDNTMRKDNKYDVKVTNEADLTVQGVNAKGAMYNGYDIIEAPTNVLGLKNNFNYHIGNVTFNYNFTAREDKHFKNDWLKNRYVRNFFKADIGNKRYLSFDFEKNDEYEFEDFKSSEIFNREIKYGYTTDVGNSFLYSYLDRNRKYYPYDTSIGWNRDEYKESLRDRTFGINYNEWGLEYTNQKNTINDIYGNSATFGTPDLKLNTKLHKIGFVYDTTKMKNKKFESDHYFRASVGFGKKSYRDINGTPTLATDDNYIHGSDYTTIGFLYRYENNAKPKYQKDIVEEKKDTKVEELQNIEMIKDSNTQDFSLVNSNKNALENIQIDDEDKLFLSTEEEEAYKSYVENETYRQNKFSLNDFNQKLRDLRKGKKYFQIGLDMEIDGSSTKLNSNLSGMKRINDLIFKVETGYLEEFYLSYKYIMERPDRYYRNAPGRNSTYNFRKHEFEGKYQFGDDPDKPWWVGAKVQYVQNGAPNASDPEIFESSSLASKVNKITLGMATLSHRFENLEWEIGAGMKWDKPDNKKLGYYPVVTLKFSVTPFPEKNLQVGYSGGRPSFGVGF